MKNKFIYRSRKQAFGDILLSYNIGVNFNTPGMIDFCFREIIRG
jgi:hypothetical protein